MTKKVLIGMGMLALGAVLLIGHKKAKQEDAGNASGLSSVQQQDAMKADAAADDNVEQTSLSAQRQGEQTGKSAPQELSAPVKALIGEDGKEHNYSSLLAEINTLSYEIAPDDLAALMAMLDYSNDQFPEGMRPIEINAVKNDVLDKLLRQTELPEGLGLHMVEIAGDADNDPVWRDYCVQFMQPFYEKKSQVERSQVEGPNAGGVMASPTANGQAGSTAPQNELTAIHDAMFQALEERGSTIAGTSLIGLELLSRTHDEFDREVIVNKASEIAADEAASSASRMTALRLSASGNLKPETGNLNPEVVDTARALAQTGETVLLRSAAIVTLGEVGGADNRELLESYTLADNKQIAGAAKMALAKMDAR